MAKLEMCSCFASETNPEIPAHESAHFPNCDKVSMNDCRTDNKRTKHRTRFDPIRLSIDRSPNHWHSQKRHETANHDLDGVVYTSNKAYQDLLDGILPLKHQFVDIFTIESQHRAEHGAGMYSFLHRHILRYRGEMVWSIETRNYCKPKETWGVRSTCSITPEGKLKVDLFKKVSQSRQGSSHETRIHDLEDILFQAAHSEPRKGITLQRGIQRGDRRMLAAIHPSGETYSRALSLEKPS